MAVATPHSAAAHEARSHTPSEFPPIEDHGLIGDLQTAALIAMDGTIDWFCSPRFDSPSVFAALLDPDRGGRFRFGVETAAGVVTRQLYFPDSAVLITRFMSPDGVGEVADFMPLSDPHRASRKRTIVRIARVVRGQMQMELLCAPRFDYGREQHELELTEHGAIFRTRSHALTLHAPGLRRDGDDVRLSRSLRQGEAFAVILETEVDGPPRTVPARRAVELFEATVGFWRRWLAKSTYNGRWREAVERSAMTLKLMTYAPTGALVAAPTAGLPEQIGGERNWDYRYTWIRDASFSVYALLGLGYTDEALAFIHWVGDRVQNRVSGGDSGPLRIMYRVDGSSDLDEFTLEHFRGYMDSHPVRIGNGASGQRQLDIYGEMMDSLYLADRRSFRLGHPGWMAVTDVIGWLREHWDETDEGIWETRGGRQDFTYGRLMSWVAIDRAIRIAEKNGLPADLQQLRSERDTIYRQIMARGWNPDRKAFVQHYGSHVLDAANLFMPLVGFVSSTDPMWQSTLDAMTEELVSDSLVYRYNPEATPDGLAGNEGTFSLCTFVYVDALARAGRLDEARLVFEKMLTYANHLGLFAEEIGPTGEQLGNFPQAFTHLALINSAINLNYMLEHDANWADFVAEGRPRR